MSKQQSNLNRLIRGRRQKKYGALPDPESRDNIDASRSLGLPIYGDGSSSGTGTMPAELVQLYLVVSKIVVDPSGAWEFPDGFPGTSSYPGKSTAPDQSVYFITERVHEEGWIDIDGGIYVIRNYWDREQPYVGDTSYNPAWYVTRNDPGPSDYASVIAAVDWATVNSGISTRWPGVTL